MPFSLAQRADRPLGRLFCVRAMLNLQKQAGKEARDYSVWTRRQRMRDWHYVDTCKMKQKSVVVSPLSSCARCLAFSRANRLGFSLST